MTLRILVTGANGFVGRQLCLELVRSGYNVRAAVRDSTKAGELPGGIVTVGTIDGKTDWSSAVSGVDAVIHLAARVHVMRETAADPAGAFHETNVSGTEALARECAKQRVRRLVFVSSIKVNGECTGKTPFTASDSPAPHDAYAVSKWEAEKSLWRIAEQTSVEIVVIRLPLVYGPHVGGNFLRLLKLVRTGLPLPFGAIENQRSLIYNRNLADALILCATHPKAAGKTYLVSDGDDWSTTRLVTELACLMHKPARLIPIPKALLEFAGRCTGRADEVDRLVGSLRIDASAIRSDLAWHPPFSMAEGLNETVQWFQAIAARKAG